jgi:hypothetical protein
MLLEKFVKQPAEVKDYDVDYAKWLGPISDVIDSVTTTVVCQSTPVDSTLVINSTFLTDTSVKLWISGGTSGKKYKITIRVTTDGGRIDESELLFIIKDF